MDKLEEQRLAEQMEEEKEVPTALTSDWLNLVDLWLPPFCSCCTVLIRRRLRKRQRNRAATPAAFVTLAQRTLAAWPPLPAYFATRGDALRGRGGLSWRHRTPAWLCRCFWRLKRAQIARLCSYCHFPICGVVGFVRYCRWCQLNHQLTGHHALRKSDTNASHATPLTAAAGFGTKCEQKDSARDELMQLTSLSLSCLQKQAACSLH